MSLDQVVQLSPPKVHDAVSVFLCPLKINGREIKKLEERWEEYIKKQIIKTGDEEIRLLPFD